MKHIQLVIAAPPAEQEILIAELTEVGAIGYEEKEESLIAYFNGDEFDGSVVNQVLNDYRYSVDSMPEQNWNSLWEANFQPVIIDNFCAIRAEFHQPIPDVAHELIITPKMSFGTGHHATTKMMIQQMRGIDFEGRDVFDFGTGTGVLSILSKKLGARSVFAIDVDDWSIRNAEENFGRNEVSGIVVSETSTLPNKTFDVVLANINRNVLLDYAEALKHLLNPEACLVLSGILVEDEGDIQAIYDRLNLKLLKRLQMDNWLSLLFSN